MDYFMAEEDDSLISHSPSNEQDIKPFSQDNKQNILILALDSITNVIILFSNDKKIICL